MHMSRTRVLVSTRVSGVLLAFVGGVSTLVLAGCAYSEPVAEFDRARGATDALPVHVAESVQDMGGDPESSRFLGADSNGSEYFATKIGDGYCFVAVDGADDAMFVSVCSELLPMKLGMNGTSAVLTKAAENVPSGYERAEKVGEQVWVLARTGE